MLSTSTAEPLSDMLQSSDNFSSVLITINNDIEAMAAKRNKDSSRATYGSHVNGKYGFVKFIEMYNVQTGPSFTIDPLSPNLKELLKIYFQLRAIKGNRNDFGITVCKGNAVDYSTVFVAYAALLAFFDNLGHMDSANPCRDPSFKLYIKGLLAEKAREKNKNRFSGRHPLYYEDIQRLLEFDFLAAGFFKHTLSQHWFKTVVVFAYSFMFRIDEVLNLQFRDICFSQVNGIWSLKIKLYDRKSVNYEDAVFTQWPNLQEPFICAVSYFSNYLNELKVQNKPTTPSSFVFPKMSNSIIKSTMKQSPSDFSSKTFKQALIAVEMSPDLYSSHSLRKGGARHRLLYSQRTWDLDTIRYWCGWSHNNDSATLGVYLLDELSKLKFEKMSQVMQYSHNVTQSVDSKMDSMIAMMNEFHQTIYLLKNQLEQLPPEQAVMSNSSLSNSHVANLDTVFLPSTQSQINFPSISSNNSQLIPPISSAVQIRPRHFNYNPPMPPQPQPAKKKRGRPKKERIVQEDDGCVEFKEFKTMNDIVIACEVGYPCNNIRPLTQWSTNARNLTPSIKSNYSQKINAYYTFKRITTGANRVSNALKDRMLRMNITAQRKICSALKNIDMQSTDSVESTVTQVLNDLNQY